MKEIVLKNQAFIELLGLPKDYFHTRWVKNNGGEEDPEKEAEEIKGRYCGGYYFLIRSEVKDTMFPTMEEFLTKKKSLVDSKGNSYIILNDCYTDSLNILVIDKNGVLELREYYTTDMMEETVQKSFIKVTGYEDITANSDVLYNYEKHMFIFNGDLGDEIYYQDESGNFIEEIRRFSEKFGENFIITISFSCFCNIFRIPYDIQPIAKLIANDGFSIVDFTPEGKIEMSDKDYKFFLENQGSSELINQTLRPPDRGYSIVRIDGLYQWHRPETLLFRYTLKGEDISVIMGMDEDSYFASVLPDHPKNIKEAYRSLVPKSIRKKKML